MILVTGATGNTGAAVLSALVERNAAVRAFVHGPGKSSAPAAVEVAAGDFRAAFGRLNG
jgi:uncharacterized protein YbjT (DUF2867 family)